MVVPGVGWGPAPPPVAGVPVPIGAPVIGSTVIGLPVTGSTGFVPPTVVVPSLVVTEPEVEPSLDEEAPSAQPLGNAIAKPRAALRVTLAATVLARPDLKVRRVMGSIHPVGGCPGDAGATLRSTS